MRVTRKDLDAAVVMLNRVTAGGYHIRRAYGQPRLVREEDAGEREISPRLPSGELLRWIRAFTDGCISMYRREEADKVKP